MSRTAVVTGASRGLGRASAIELTRRGWHVIATMRAPDRDAPSLQDEVETHAGRLEAITLDLLDERSIETVAKGLQRTPIDALIHVAGVAPVGTFEDTPRREWEQTFQANLLGPMHLTSLLLPAMRQRGTGRIIAVASIAARIGMPLSSVYGASKAGLERWIESLSVELHPFGLSAHVLEAGLFDTDLVRDGALPDGDGPYRAMYERFEPRRSRVLKLAKPAAGFATTLVDLVESKRPPVVKPVGADATAVYLAHRLIPSRVMTAAMHRAFH